MKKNMGSTDTIIRLAVVGMVIILFYTNLINGTLAVVLGIIGLIFLITSIFSFCPLYKLLGFSTCKNNKYNHN